MRAFSTVKDEYLPADYPSWTAVGVTQLAVQDLLVEVRRRRRSGSTRLTVRDRTVLARWSTAVGARIRVRRDVDEVGGLDDLEPVPHPTRHDERLARPTSWRVSAPTWS